MDAAWTMQQYGRTCRSLHRAAGCAEGCSGGAGGKHLQTLHLHASHRCGLHYTACSTRVAAVSISVCEQLEKLAPASAVPGGMCLMHAAAAVTLG